MRLSMWILADYLRDFHPGVYIQRGERILRSARLFSGEAGAADSCVYLDCLQKDLIVCFSGNDMLVIRADDINAVFNRVLDAFDFYNDWSERFYGLIRSGCEARDLLRAGAEILDRLLILADATFYMREVYRSGDAAVWDGVEGRMLPHHVLLEINALPHIRAPRRPTYLIAPGGIRPGAAVTNLSSGTSHGGWLVTVNETGEYTRGSMDLQDALGERLSVWLERSEAHGGRMEKAGIFKDLLERPGAAEERADDRLRVFDWLPSDRKQVYAIRRVAPEMDPMNAIERYLEAINPYSFLLRYDGCCLYIVNHRLSPASAYEERLQTALAQCGCAAGRSPLFTGLAEFPAYYRSALIALRFAPAVPGDIRAFEETELPYAASLLREHSVIDLRHPALRTLREYDLDHGTQLFGTLDKFLSHNCSYADTAAELYIHRSTLLYRLQRISELTGLSLKHYPTQLHLQISFLIEGGGGPIESQHRAAARTKEGPQP